MSDEQTFLLVGNILMKVAATIALSAITPNLMMKSMKRPQSIIIVLVNTLLQRILHLMILGTIGTILVMLLLCSGIKVYSE